MKSKLPQYVVNCFISAGFDTLKVISHMDVSNNAYQTVRLLDGNYSSDCDLYVNVLVCMSYFIQTWS